MHWRRGEHSSALTRIFEFARQDFTELVSCGDGREGRRRETLFTAWRMKFAKRLPQADERHSTRLLRSCGGPFLHLSPNGYTDELFGCLQRVAKSFNMVDYNDRGLGPDGYLSTDFMAECSGMAQTPGFFDTLKKFLAIEREFACLSRFIEGQFCVFCEKPCATCNFGCPVYQEHLNAGSVFKS